jgi:hypothetical protein
MSTIQDVMVIKCRVAWIRGKPGDCIQEPAEECSCVCSSTYGFGVLRSRVWNQDLGSVRATLPRLVLFLFLFVITILSIA